MPEMITIRLTAAERDLLRATAYAHGLSLNAWCVGALLREAERVGETTDNVKLAMETIHRRKLPILGGDNHA